MRSIIKEKKLTNSCWKSIILCFDDDSVIYDLDQNERLKNKMGRAKKRSLSKNIKRQKQENAQSLKASNDISKKFVFEQEVIFSRGANENSNKHYLNANIKNKSCISNSTSKLALEPNSQNVQSDLEIQCKFILDELNKWVSLDFSESCFSFDY